MYILQIWFFLYLTILKWTILKYELFSISNKNQKYFDVIDIFGSPLFSILPKFLFFFGLLLFLVHYYFLFIRILVHPMFFSLLLANMPVCCHGVNKTTFCWINFDAPKFYPKINWPTEIFFSDEYQVDRVVKIVVCVKFHINIILIFVINLI